MRQVLAVLVALALAFAADAAAAAGRMAVLPWNVSPPAPAFAWLAEGPHVLTGLLLGAQAGWEPLPADQTARIAAAWGPSDGPPAAAAIALLAAAGARPHGGTIDAKAVRPTPGRSIDVGGGRFRVFARRKAGQITAISCCCRGRRRSARAPLPGCWAAVPSPHSSSRGSSPPSEGATPKTWRRAGRYATA
jgi:hypothetical protein